MPEENGSPTPGEWNQALMELGATVCVPREPRCLVCPVREACEARRLGKERELPVVVAKARQKQQSMVALVVRRGGEVLLAQRGETARLVMAKVRPAMVFSSVPSVRQKRTDPSSPPEISRSPAPSQATART